MIKRIWRGELPLWASYWIVGVGGAAFLGVPVFAAMLALTDIPEDDVASLFLGALAFLLCYQIWASVGIWRSASSYGGDPTWALAAKLCVAASALGVILMALSVIFADVT